MSALAMSLGGSALATALLLTCRPVLRRLCGVRAAYACWALAGVGAAAPLLGLLIPPALLAEPAHAVGGAMAPALALILHVAGGRADAALLWRVTGALWAIGAALFLARAAVEHRRFAHAAARDAERRQVGGITILQGPGTATPAAFGILRRRIALPADFAGRFSPAEQLLVLHHERAHHERLDLVANLLALLLLASHWWNPLADRAHRRFREDQELACDATVTRNLDAGQRRLYGAALLKAARIIAAPASACGLAGHRTALRTRIEALCAPPRAGSVWRGALAGMLAIGIAASSGAAMRALSLAGTPAAAHVTLLAAARPHPARGHDGAIWAVALHPAHAPAWHLAHAVLHLPQPSSLYAVLLEL